MSIIRCTLCEVNRPALTQAVQDIFNVLGTHAPGKQPLLSNLKCTKCQSKEKSFLIDPFDVFFEHYDLKININSIATGEFLVELEAGEYFDKLALINAIVRYLNNLKDFDIDDIGNVHIGYTALACMCGNITFELET